MTDRTKDALALALVVVCVLALAWIALTSLTGCDSRPAQQATEAMTCGHNGSVEQCPGEQP